MTTEDDGLEVSDNETSGDSELEQTIEDEIRETKEDED